MKMPRQWAHWVVAATSVIACGAAFAQAWPSRPVKIIVPFGPGGAADSLPRLVGSKLAEYWGQPVVVENRTGAAGNIGMEAAAKSAPDGYTLLSAPVGNLAVNPHLYPKFALDVFKDLTPITLVASVQNVLVVNPAVQAATLAELVALAKQKPASLSFASGGSGTQAHLGGEILKAMAGIEINHVAYKGVGDAVRDLLGGHVQMMVAQLPSVLQQIQAGKLRALGLAAAKRTSVLPNLPTLNEAGGFTGFEAVSWYALAGPAGIPKPIVDRIQSDVVRALAVPDVREKLLALGADPVGSTPQELTAAMKVDYDRYGAVIRRLGIKVE
jgi:tripartite-type tricarboxylate transporter receptor subunit TctC